LFTITDVRNSAGWCRINGTQDHRRYIRWVGRSWRWSILRERFLQGWSIRRLRCSMGR